MKHGKKAISVLLIMAVLISFAPVYTYTHAASNDDDPMIVVSMGDSYSAGEGIEKFYGQDKPVEEKVLDYDWLAHRSQKSWPGRLKIPGVEGTMADYKCRIGDIFCEDEVQWYFCAVSGAQTKHFTQEQKKEYDQDTGWIGFDETGFRMMKPQMDVFIEEIQGKVDYVTLTIGGNDVGFSDIITTCAVNCSYLFVNGSSDLEDTFDELWDNFDTTRANLKSTYEDIQEKAGEQAHIIVAGYPELLDKDGKGAVINRDEATTVNENVRDFNDEIEQLVWECRNSGMNIHFVDVEEAFDGHQAYSDDPWINEILLPARDEDLDDEAIVSDYSIHPNDKGAQAYADLVNAKIAEIEREKTIGTLHGKICKASDRTTPIQGAIIEVFQNGERVKTDFSSFNGQYAMKLPAGQYYVKITAEGYIDFASYATVEAHRNTYMETFLMIEGDVTSVGAASGKVVNSLTGVGAPDITLSFLKDWNSQYENTEVFATTTTDAYGNYSIELPIGNYTVMAFKREYTPSYFNIIVQPGETGNQNGTITPVVTEGLGDQYLITLTWGANPSDLDSHLVGTTTGGSSFHVYYSAKYAHDGGQEICNLDYDDTSSYGPEHITLTTTNDTPYYYYVYKYAGEGTVCNSEAKVTIERGNTLIAEFNVPTDLGDGRYWNIFAIKEGQLIINNTITDEPELAYAN